MTDDAAISTSAYTVLLEDLKSTHHQCPSAGCTCRQPQTRAYVLAAWAIYSSAAAPAGLGCAGDRPAIAELEATLSESTTEQSTTMDDDA